MARQFDLLVVELALGDIHGLELVEILRQRSQLNPATAVLVHGLSQRRTLRSLANLLSARPCRLCRPPRRMN